MAEPGAHARAGTIGDGTVLDFGAGAGENSLPLSRPGD
jgi:hypothetical protein